MQYQDYLRSYEAKDDEELLRLQLDSEHLTQEACAALTSALTKRRIGDPSRLSAFREQETRRIERLSRNPGNLFLSFRLGVGQWYFGKADRVHEPGTGIERFRTTVFILFLWFPLVPTGSYFVQKKRGYFASSVTILKRLPLDWAQVLRVWATAAAGLTAVIFVLRHIL